MKYKIVDGHPKNELDITPEAKAKFNQLLNLEINDRCSINLSLATFVEKTKKFRLLTAQIRPPLSQEFRTIIKNFVSTVAHKNQSHEFQLRPYAGGENSAAYEVEHLKHPEVATIGEVIAAFYPLTNCEVFSGKRDVLEAIRFYVLVVEPEAGDPIFFFRYRHPARYITKKGWVNVFCDDGVFNKAESTLLSFDDQIDCVAYGEDMYIFNSHNFHMMFQFFEEAKRRAASNADKLNAKIPIDNFAAFKNSCSGSFFMSVKLNAIVNKDYLQHVTMDKIETAISRHSLSIRIITSPDGSKKLQFTDDTKWEILHILEDAYVVSEMTGNEYLAHQKRLKKGVASPSSTNGSASNPHPTSSQKTSRTKQSNVPTAKP